MIFIAYPHWHRAHALHLPHPRQRTQFAQSTAPARLDEPGRNVVLLHQPVFNFDHVVDRTSLEIRHQHDAAGKGQTDDGKQRLDRTTLNLPPDDARRLRQALRARQAFDERAAEALRRGRPHGLRDRLIGGGIDRITGACQRSRQAHARAGGHHRPVEREIQKWKAEVHLVQTRQQRTQPGAGSHADGSSRQTNQRHDQPIVQRHLRRAVAEGLENCHLVTLGADQPLEHHVQQEGSHTQENGGEQPRHHAQLPEFLFQKVVGELVGPSDRATATVARQNAIHGIDGLAFVGARRQPGHDLVEGSSHIQGGRQRAPWHPDDGVALVVGKHGARLDLVQVLRRNRNADDLEPLRMAVHRGAQTAARFQSVRLRKRVADQHFVVRERRRHAPGAQIQAVERRRARIRQRDHSSLNRFVEAGHLQLGGSQYTRLHFGNAGRFGNPRSHGFGRTLESGPQISKAVVLIQPRTRVAQRIERGLRHDQHGNA